MKKIIILLLLLASLTVMSEAQNANRSGVFIELGPGFSASSESPINGAHLDGIDMKLERSTGMGFLFNTGYRYTKWISSAIEMKVQYQANFSHTASTSLIKFMPGYKWFAAKTLGGTIFGANVGVVLSSTGSIVEPGNVKPAGFLNPLKIGFAWSVELGYAINRNLYACFVWDSQYTKGQTTSEIETCTWGMFALKAGYRF